MWRLLFLLFLLTQCSGPGCPDPASVAPPPVEIKPERKEQSSPAAPSIPDYDTIQWTDLAFLDPTIRLDIRYATTNNFVGEQLYECGRCFLRPNVAEALLKVHLRLQEKGWGLKMLDCYRPHSVQWKLWNKVPDRRYVTDPRKGSMHNRGAAVDLTIVNATGEELDMGTPYDFFGVEAYHTYAQLPEQVLANRKLLKELMETHGFRSIRTEWWHYYYAGGSYPLSDMVWSCEGALKIKK